MVVRVGVFGGTFDPIHSGHLLLAEFCREQADLDQILFVPAAVSPHKIGSNPVSATDRMAMVELAISGNPSFAVCDLEIGRGGISYTVDSLQTLKDDDPARELFFLMGADSLVDFPQWREPQRICELATILVVARPGWQQPSLQVLREFVDDATWQTHPPRIVRSPQVDIRSREIRLRVSDGRSIRYQTTRAVEQYIRSHELYRAPPE